MNFANPYQLALILLNTKKRSKIIIMDEITAFLDDVTSRMVKNIDFGSDAIIISIAHKLKEFLHFDRVIVLENGAIVQNDTMNAALKTSNSPFMKLLDVDSHIGQ